MKTSGSESNAWSIASMFQGVMAAGRDPVTRMRNVDLLAVLIALLLPWSTSGVGIACVLWLIALVPTLEIRAFAQSLKRPVCLLPIALFLLATVGMLWSDASWSARLHAVGPAAKLLVIPALLFHFERSSRGMWVFVAFLVSCTLLMLVSWLVMFEPSLSLRQDDPERGIFVKNYIAQGQEFALCAVALAYPIYQLFRENRRWLALLLCAVVLSLLANMAFVVISRTALVTMPIMLAVFAALHLRLRASMMILAAVVVLAGLSWVASPALRNTIDSFARDYREYKETNRATSIGLRLEYWRKSVGFIMERPFVGHGTGSTRLLFERAATGPEVLASGRVIDNPHNQTLNVAVQWGVIGIALLWAMWLWHLRLFRGDGLVAWIGLLVVVQNIFTSLFNSHVFDFHEGWIYVLGVGVAGGMVLKQDAGKAGEPR